MLIISSAKIYRTQFDKLHFLGHQCFGTKSQQKTENILDVMCDHQLTAPVYIDDTQGDYEATTKAGIPFIFADYGFGTVSEGMVATISNFADLTDLV